MSSQEKRKSNCTTVKQKSLTLVSSRCTDHFHWDLLQTFPLNLTYGRNTARMTKHLRHHSPSRQLSVHGVGLAERCSSARKAITVKTQTHTHKHHSDLMTTSRVSVPLRNSCISCWQQPSVFVRGLRFTEEQKILLKC